MELLRKHNAAWVNIWSVTSAYYHALLGNTARVPPVSADHQLSTIHFLASGKPMMEMIENQAYLVQGAYAKVIGRSTGQLTVCEAMHYALVTLHIRIQTATAYEMLGKRSEAREVLERALRDVEPDELLLLFVENYRYLKDLLISCAEHNEFIQCIVQLGGAYEVKRKQIQNQTARPAALAPLMEREYEIAGLLAECLSNREIAEKLFLFELSIKQYINQIYTKLHIEGDTRTQRKQLSELFSQKT